MLKHADELPPVRVVRTQIMRGRRRRSLGAVTGPIKICRWPRLSGSAGLPWRPTKPPRDAQIDSCLINPSRPTGTAYFRRSKAAIRMLLATADGRSVSYLKSQISCLVSPSHLVSSFWSLTRLTRSEMMKSNYRRAVSKSWLDGAVRASSSSRSFASCRPRREPAVDGDVGCPGPCVVPIVAPRRLAVNDNGSLSVFAISLNDRNHLLRFKFFLFDQGYVSAVISAVVSIRTHDDRVVQRS
jgi:hypothetical protein